MKFCSSFMYSEHGDDPLSGTFGLAKSSSCMVNKIASTASVKDANNGCKEFRIKVAICFSESVTDVTHSSGRPDSETMERLKLRSNWCRRFTTPAFVFCAAVGGPITCDASPSDTKSCSALTAIIWMVLQTFFVTKWHSLTSTNDTVNSLYEYRNEN